MPCPDHWTRLGGATECRGCGAKLDQATRRVWSTEEGLWCAPECAEAARLLS